MIVASRGCQLQRPHADRWLAGEALIRQWQQVIRAIGLYKWSVKATPLPESVDMHVVVQKGVQTKGMGACRAVDTTRQRDKNRKSDSHTVCDG